ncbi:hypothetical protein ACGFJ5_04770 [Micromonospora echinaurantiaca]|uniref:hypothetical protein n=1 Tax=Micromonospora echinaurantiaca TaxID=47857 RepID=UPI00371C237B
MPPDELDGRQRHERLRQASRMLIGGDMVGGDKLVMMLGGRESAPLQRLGTQLSDPVRYAFVPPEQWDRTRAILNERRLVVLRADPHQGKTAAAIRLLQSPSDRRIYNLDRNVDLRSFAAWLERDACSDQPLPRGAGFLLCEPVGWDDVRGWMLQQLDAALERIDARLVLTLSAEAALGDEDIREYVVPLGRAQPHAAILASHLTWRLGNDAGLCERLLADESLSAYVRDLFSDSVSRKEAADLAVVISQELSGTVVDLDRVRRRMAERHTEDFDIWFGGLPDVTTRCLAIALAVLNGLSYESVVRAADRLADRLDGPADGFAGDNPVPLRPWRNPFGRNRRELLRLLRAQIRPATVRGDWGPVRVESMQYAADDYPGLVLSHVWHEFQVHRELLDWLRDLTSDGNEDVHTWAGTALGMLSRYAFDVVYTQVLHRMAVDPNQWRNGEVVAYALRVPATDSRLRPLVDAVVNALYADRNSPMGQATAARVHGVSLGPQGVPQALAALDRLATIDHRDIAKGISDGLADLILQDEQGNAPLVLERVSSWINDRRRSLVGQFVFLRLAQSLTTDVTLPGPDGAARGPVTWPTLLILADQRRELRPGLVGMWLYVLRSGTFSRQVERTIAAWAALAEAEEDVRTSLCRLLRDTAARGERIQKMILRHAASWRAVDNLRPTPHTAYAVEAALNARDGAL